VIKIGEELTMKIWGNIPKVSGVYGNTSKVDRYAKVGETSSKKDELSISGTAKDFSVAMKAMRQIPDVRQEKINEIIQKMERGDYSVKASEVAEKIITAFEDSKI
jgi:negative regulator of flagellin synthesis FlgM